MTTRAPEPIRGTLHAALAALWEATLRHRAARGEAPPPQHLNPEGMTMTNQQQPTPMNPAFTDADGDPTHEYLFAIHDAVAAAGFQVDNSGDVDDGRLWFGIYLGNPQTDTERDEADRIQITWDPSEHVDLPKARWVVRRFDGGSSWATGEADSYSTPELIPPPSEVADLVAQIVRDLTEEAGRG